MWYVKCRVVFTSSAGLTNILTVCQAVSLRPICLTRFSISSKLHVISFILFSNTHFSMFPSLNFFHSHLANWWSIMRGCRRSGGRGVRSRIVSEQHSTVRVTLGWCCSGSHEHRNRLLSAYQQARRGEVRSRDGGGPQSVRGLTWFGRYAIIILRSRLSSSCR